CSPRRAGISPRRTSKSTPSLARTPGNRLVILRIVTAGGFSASTPPSPRGGGFFIAPMSAAFRAADYPLHEPVHAIELIDGQLLSCRDVDRPRLVLQGPRKFIETAVLVLIHPGVFLPFA